MNATGVTAGPAESNGKLLLGTWRDSLHVTCGLTACTPGSAPGPTLGNEYGKTLPFFYVDTAEADTGTVADMAATRKTEKYSTLSSALRFEPVAVEILASSVPQL